MFLFLLPVEVAILEMVGEQIWHNASPINVLGLAPYDLWGLALPPALATSHSAASEITLLVWDQHGPGTAAAFARLSSSVRIRPQTDQGSLETIHLFQFLTKTIENIKSTLSMAIQKCLSLQFGRLNNIA